jgi:hypothetical protein
LADDGSCLITKPLSSGGAVNRMTVCEQLVYEIADPKHYLTPDVDVDFTAVKVKELGPDRVAVSGARGRPPPEQLKVSLAYRDGFMASGHMLVYGPDCLAKAKTCAQIVQTRLAEYRLDRIHVEYLGTGQGAPRGATSSDPPEVMLRIAVHDQRREVVDRFARELAPLATSGPAGLAGYASGRPEVRPVFAYWPTLVPRGLVEPTWQVRTAEEWCDQSL